MADKQISEFPGSLPEDTDLLHTKKSNGEDNRTTVLSMKQHILAAIPAAVQYHELTTKSINGADIIKFENANQETYHKSTFLALKNYIGNLTWPVGSVYQNRLVDTNPATLLGFGSWVKIEGMFLSAAGTATDAGGVNRTFTAGTTNGRHTVQLQQTELPAHKHLMFSGISVGGPVAGDVTVSDHRIGWGDENYRIERGQGTATAGGTSNTGSNAHHENTPLNVPVHTWYRVA